ncbi:toprim domain-containing protein [Phaeobacter gallaeciensis]|uniref:toprim domain-containing protein n=1 Tax=Phaeobacter gallaeciensis TaxID=60890 RepID=UPI00237FAA29|nr:toprim domain-containing protein [Phaeobacter gallaeciensis]MDE4140965.1 toprim domain-containing protein [Phaeobacter gallaeciensis]MDE4149410.1 toprim domain-containing protein [Phaeobacter gallaeciensis]MDE4153397.1 toprim domain-containing protein [Phaeobacter gallaeciensis]MDE4228786.1 toprim domain-containing protein [Phaeobacter gallaeciensis]MDE4257861.1 toprim domain-containing protein [Phaeobacter gallaeciensis]
MKIGLPTSAFLSSSFEGDVSARNICNDLGGTWRGSYGTAPCPVCQPERRRDQDALTLRDGTSRLVMNCKKGGCDFVDILAAAGLSARDYSPPSPEVIAQRAAAQEAEARKRAMQASTCWDESLPAQDTPVESYLRGRCITARLPAGIRYHPECWHGPSARRQPAMVSAVNNEGGEAFGLPVSAVHRTFLEPDGYGGWRKARVEQAKLMLGATRGGYVELDSYSPCAPLVVCEGIETGLSLLSGLFEQPVSVWAALSTSGMKSLRLPAASGHLYLAPDADEAGMQAARVLGQTAVALGWKVGVVRSPADGGDWNDELKRRALALATEGVA